MERQARQGQRPGSLNPRLPVTAATSPAPLQADAVVIGSGPVGLFQVFQLGLHGIHAHLIDALPHLGGQCAELYPDKPIYDIPGVPMCTGRGLVELLTQQMAPFAPTLHLGQQVSTLQCKPDGLFELSTTSGLHLQSRNVFIAAGVGAFVPRTLKLEGLEAYLGTQLHYHPNLQALPSLVAERAVVVHGGDEPAVAAALACAAQGAASVTLLHRRDAFQAAPALLNQLQAARDSGRIHVVAGQLTQILERNGQLAGLELINPEGLPQQLAVEQLLVYLGISPRLGPIADWGLALERKQLPVDTAHFATEVPGIYAVGDINTYPGKRKLILCGFHEATLAAFAAAERLSASSVPLQYTTTSTKLHERLGVLPAPAHPSA
jgi:thioredoxin reductase (NADPH)